MIIPARRIGFVILASAVAGCSGLTGPGDSGRIHSDLSFRLDGRTHRAVYVSGDIRQGAFGISAADYGGYGHLRFWVDDWTGAAGTFDITPGDSRRGAEFAGPEWIGPGDDDPRFSTARYGGSGRITLRSAPTCWTSTGTDPVTGIHGTTTHCTLSGTFAFAARNCRGEEVRITKGEFRVTVQRRAPEPDADDTTVLDRENDDLPCARGREPSASFKNVVMADDAREIPLDVDDLGRSDLRESVRETVRGLGYTPAEEAFWGEFGARPTAEPRAGTLVVGDLSRIARRFSADTPQRWTARVRRKKPYFVAFLRTRRDERWAWLVDDLLRHSDLRFRVCRFVSGSPPPGALALRWAMSSPTWPLE